MKSILKNIPFSLTWTLRSLIGRKIDTVLDLGCGNGEFMNSLSDEEKWDITGVDIYSDHVLKAKKLGIYKEFVIDDVEEAVRNLISKNKKFGIVFCSQTIEHLDKKKGMKLLELIEKIALKRIIITTPRGFVNSCSELFDGNPHQIHKSGWSEKEFRGRGYEVFGYGFKYIWKEGDISWRKNRMRRYLLTLTSLIMAPFVYHMPKIGSGLICVKKCEV